MRTRKAVLNFISVLVDQISRLTVLFLLTPFILFNMGEIAYGYWQIIVRYGAQLINFDGRPSEGLKWSIARNQFTSDEVKNKFIADGIGVFLLASPIMISISFACYYAFPLIIDVGDYEDSFRISGYIYTINIFILSLTALADGLFRGMNIGYKRMGLMAFFILVTGLFCYIAVKKEGGLIGLSIAQLLGSLLYLSVFLLVIKKHLPWVNILKPEKKSVIIFSKKSFWFSIWGFLSAIIFLGEVIFLSFFSTANIVASYSISAFIIQTVIVFVAVAIGAIMPGFGQLIEKKEFKKASEIDLQARNLLGILAFSGMSVILLLNEGFVSLWVGIDRHVNDFDLLLMILSAIQVMYMRYYAVIINLNIDIKKKVEFGLISVFIISILSFILVPKYGIAGICVSMIIGRLPLYFSMVAFAYRNIITIKKPSNVRFLNLIVRFIQIALCFYMSELIGINSYFELFFYIICTSFILITANTLVLNKIDREIVLDRLRILLKG